MTRLKLGSLTFFALNCCLSPAWASSPAFTPTAPSPFGEPADFPGKMFSCTAKLIPMAKEQLEKLAIAEIEKRGQRVDSYESKVSTRDCDWIVGIKLKPAAPGADFIILIDGVTGQVKGYFAGN